MVGESKTSSIAKHKAIKADWRYLVRYSEKRARELISFDLASKYCVLPISVIKIDEQDFINVLSNQKLNHFEIEELRFYSGCRINVEYTNDYSLENAIQAAYKTEDQSLINAINNSVRVVKPLSADLPEINESEIPRLLNRILDRAELLLATDVHIEPIDNRYRVRFRVCGQLLEDELIKLDLSVAKNLIRCIKVKSKIENNFGPCDGKFKTEGFGSIREIRVSVLPLAEESKVVLRLFNNEYLADLDTLGLTLFQKHILETALSFDYGSIIIAGPTGSGKSTILYSCLENLKQKNLNIVTVEDPVEHRISGASQVDLSITKSLKYSDVLPYVLRQDPDILMLGEIRDSKTAHLAFEAALTGKLLLSTIHSANSIEAILRLVNLGVNANTLASSLRLLISGRLVAKNCEKCLAQDMIPKRFKDYYSIKENIYMYSTGCAECLNTKYSGRIGAYEFLPVSSEIRKNMEVSFSLEIIKELANRDGFDPYSVQIIDYLVKGIISLDSACRALGVSRKLLYNS